MSGIEQILYQYISQFYDNYDRQFIKSDLLIDFAVEKFQKDFDSIEWKEIEILYKKLIPYCTMDGFHLEVADRASYFIKKIFQMYVDDDTFVLHSSFEHPNVIKELENVKHKKGLFYNQIVTFDVDKFLNEFKTSKCKKLFVYVPGTSVCTGQIIPQNFFIKIKQCFEKNNIKCQILCDDVHGMFITPRDYSIFDFVLYTCHSYIPGFDMGMLWSKKTEKIGFTNINRAKSYYERLILFLSKLDKIRLFPILLTEYFSGELENNKFLDLYTNTTSHIFALKTKGLIFNQFYYDKCNKYRIELGETKAFINFIRLRIQEFVIEEPEFLLEGLQLVKKAISSFESKAEMYQNEAIFDGKKNIKQTITENILFE